MSSVRGVPARRSPGAKAGAWSLLALLVASDLVATTLLALRATRLAAGLGMPLRDAVLWQGAAVLALLASAVWTAALAWALLLDLEWARTAQAFTDLVLAAGAAAWVLPGLTPTQTVLAQSVALGLALMVALPALFKGSRIRAAG